MKKLLFQLVAILLVSTGLMAQVTVTYKVDITDYLAAGNTLGAGGIRIGGNFSDQGATNATGTAIPNWTPSNPLCALSNEGNNIWAITITYPASSVGATQLYKFVNNDWGTNEGTDPANTLVSGGCAVLDGGNNTNRTFVIPAANTTLCYVWDGCAPCGAPPTPAVVTTDTVVSNILINTATVKGLASGSNITTRGFCYGTTPNPNLDNDIVVNVGAGSGSFSTTLTGLAPSTTYYVRAFATNAAGDAYGNQASFTTFSQADFAVVSTSQVSAVTNTSASCGGNVTSGGSSPVTARGIIWSTSPNPTVNLGTKTVDGSGTGEFTSSITGIGPGLTFYVRAYATNSAGTVYGEERTFTTTGTALPNIQVTYKVDITNYLANNSQGLGPNKMRIGGNFAAFGAKRGDSLMVDWTPSNKFSRMDSLGNNIWGITVTYPTSASGSMQEYKFVNNDWGTNEGTDAEHTIDIGGCGMPWGNRSLAIPFTNQEVCYTWDACVTCGSVLNLPEITSSSFMMVNPSDTSVSLSGTASGDAIGRRGFCINTLPNPTIGNQVINAGKGAGDFSATLNGLMAGNTYYIRAFAKNLTGVSYGPEMVLSTSSTADFVNRAILKAVPNPASGKVQFAGFSGNGELVMKNIHGMEVMRRSINAADQIDISQLPASAYFFTLQNKEGIYRGKLIRE